MSEQTNMTPEEINKDASGNEVFNENELNEIASGLVVSINGHLASIITKLKNKIKEINTSKQDKLIPTGSLEPGLYDENNELIMSWEDFKLACPNNFSGSKIINAEDNEALIQNSIGKLIIGNDITELEDAVFMSCTELTSIIIPDSVITLGADMFDNCEKLKSVTFGKNISSITDRMFTYCTSLTSVTIPNSINSIGEYVFSTCDALENIYYTGSKRQWNTIEIDESNNEILNQVIIHYPTDYVLLKDQATSDVYKVAMNNGEVNIEEINIEVAN